ncbi:MAG: peptidase domain-containing ABC transporter [Bacteroidota bacterium]
MYSWNNFPIYRQMDANDCGPTALRMVARYYGQYFEAQDLRERCHITRDGVSIHGIVEAAESVGMKTLALTTSYDSLRDEVPLPCIAHWQGRHFVVIYKIRSGKVYVADPAYGKITYGEEEFRQNWLQRSDSPETREGWLILLEPGYEFLERNEYGPRSRKGWNLLFPYLRKYRSYLGQLFLGLILSSLLQLLFPFLTQAIVDQGIRYDNISFINLVLIAQLMLFFSQMAVQVIRGWLLLHLGARINISLASDFLIKLLKLPLTYFDSRTTGDMLQRVQDNRKIELFLTSTSLNVIFSLFNIVVFSLVLAFYHWGIFMVFIGGAILYVLWILRFMKKREELDYKRFDQAVVNVGTLIEMVQGIHEIKLNNSERKRRWRWESIQVKLYNISSQGLSLTQYQETGGGFINELKNILISFLAATAVIQGEMSLGMMLAVQYIIGQLNAPLVQFIEFVRQAQDARISLERLSEVQRESEEQHPEMKGLVEISQNKPIYCKNLSFQYGGPSSPKILDTLNLEIPAGKVTAIVGVSGSGKSTLLKLLLKLYAPTSGDVLVGESKLEYIHTPQWRQVSGVVMQDGFIFNDSILQNIIESDNSGYIDKDRLRRAVKIANLESFIEALPAGYHTLIGPRGSSGVSLSGGQAQRVLIARAIYKDPDYLFLDEATSALDALNERSIMEKMESFFEGRTVVIIAHRLSTVKHADKILVLAEGKLAEEGNHEELTKKKGLYYTLVKNQLELGT